MGIQQGRINSSSSLTYSITRNRSIQVWDEFFVFGGCSLRYNRIPFNNCAERAVEVPLAFSFLARTAHSEAGSGHILELGNVLHSYENGLSEAFGLCDRRVVDKFEVAPGVDNIDFMDIDLADKYNTILSISTVEHIGQHCAPSGEFGEQIQSTNNREAPLHALAKIYDLLVVGGKALVTVPAGRLTDGGWYIQFSPAYLELLTTWYGVPRQGVTLHFLRQVARQPRWYDLGRNPHQTWCEATADEIKDARYDDVWGGARAIAVIELTKGIEPYVLPDGVVDAPLVYATLPWRKRLAFLQGSLLRSGR